MENFKNDNLAEQSFDVKIDKVEKGSYHLLKGHRFQTGCYVGADKSALFEKPDGNPKMFRFYLSKSFVENSGYKVIEYEPIK